MGLINFILQFFAVYPAIICFLGGIFGGEETIFILSILAVQNNINFLIIIFFSYLGILVSDIIWFFLGRTKLFNWLIKRKIFSKVYYHFDKTLDKVTKGNDFKALLFTKFLYGLRIITIMYLARERMKFKQFLKYSLIIVGIWTIVVCSLGFAAGQGVKIALIISNNLTLTLILFGITIILFNILIRILSEEVKKLLTKRQKR